MTLASMYYRDTRPDPYLELQSFDGTIRGVVFRDHDAKKAAMAEGRAEIDCTAIANGILPRGATLVTRATAPDAKALLEELRRPGNAILADPLNAVRLGFSLKLMAGRSEYIDEQRDADARRRDPDAARRYDAIVDALLASGRDDHE